MTQLQLRLDGPPLPRGRQGLVYQLLLSGRYTRRNLTRSRIHSKDRNMNANRATMNRRRNHPRNREHASAGMALEEGK